VTVATFVYASWAARFPEFAATVSSSQAADLFTNEAGLYLDNTDSSPVPDIPTRTRLLWLVTAHLAQLAYGSALKPLGPLVGRIDSATQGSVSVTAKYPDQAGLAAWFAQTPYGAEFWVATAYLRQFRYRAPAPRRFWPA
jgi:hypothetical protein